MTTTEDLIRQLDLLGDEFAAQVAPLVEEQAIRAAQAQYLGKKGKVSDFMKEMGRLPAGDRPKAGAAMNRIKDAIEGSRCSAAPRGTARGTSAATRAANASRTAETRAPRAGSTSCTAAPRATANATFSVPERRARS